MDLIGGYCSKEFADYYRKNRFNSMQKALDVQKLFCMLWYVLK